MVPDRLFYSRPDGRVCVGQNSEGPRLAPPRHRKLLFQVFPAGFVFFAGPLCVRGASLGHNELSVKDSLQLLDSNNSFLLEASRLLEAAVRLLLVNSLIATLSFIIPSCLRSSGTLF